MHNSPRYSKRAVCTPLFGVSIVAVALLIIMGCLVQAIREALATEVSVEIGKPISLLSNQALGPVLHSLIQMRVQRAGLAKLHWHTPPQPNPPHPTAPLSLKYTSAHSHYLALLRGSLTSCISPAFNPFSSKLFSSSPLAHSPKGFGDIRNSAGGSVMNEPQECVVVFIRDAPAPISASSICPIL